MEELPNARSWSRSRRAEMTAYVSPPTQQAIDYLGSEPSVPPTTFQKSESTTHLVQDPGNGP